MAVLTADIGSHPENLVCRDVDGDELIVFVHVEAILSMVTAPNTGTLVYMSGPPLNKPGYGVRIHSDLSFKSGSTFPW